LHVLYYPGDTFLGGIIYFATPTKAICAAVGKVTAGLALALRDRLRGISTHGLKGLCEGDKHPDESPPSSTMPPLPCLYCLSRECWRMLI